tara:strand:- start:413 stop:913 length:501 start_codon:yes stop_codon:yes gene_type:complete
MITVKDVLQNKPRGAFIYKIMYNKEIPFYVGMSLRDIQARFKTHMAKYYGEKKYPDRERCQEVVTEHEDLRFKCTGRQTHGYRTIREIFRKHDIDFDLFNADVELVQLSSNPLNDYGTDLAVLTGTSMPFTNKFEIERMETDIIARTVPLANDESVHLAEKRLKKV